jgi:hypothetical protein
MAVLIVVLYGLIAASALVSRVRQRHLPRPSRMPLWPVPLLRRARVIHRFSVGRLSCIVVSDGQPKPPWEPPLDSFFTPGSGVPAAELADAVAAEGAQRTKLTGGYNCLLVETSAGLAVIDTGLGAGFPGYGPAIGKQVGKLGEGLMDAGLSAADLAAVVFTHLHQDHVRGATWPGELAFPAATGGLGSIARHGDAFEWRPAA